MTTTVQPELTDPPARPTAQNGEYPEPPTFESMLEERQYRKEQLAAGFRLFGKFGFSEGAAGHITVRDPENPEWFWVNPFGMSFNQIKVSDLLLVDHSGKVLHGDRPLNRAAFCIHSQVHKARPDAIAAAHSHSLYGKAFASLGILLDPIIQDACAFYEDHSIYSDYHGVIDQLDEGERIGKALGPHKAVILQNHGLLTVGQSVAAAVWWFVTMERSCQAQLLAMAAGKPIPIDHTTARQVCSAIGTPLAGWLQARPMWDQIVATAPDMFD
jgi:ribulose-5-phosphate 4-epimerase/fuculose-1-phosphate aldolase